MENYVLKYHLIHKKYLAPTVYIVCDKLVWWLCLVSPSYPFLEKENK